MKTCLFVLIGIIIGCLTTISILAIIAYDFYNTYQHLCNYDLQDEYDRYNSHTNGRFLPPRLRVRACTILEHRGNDFSMVVEQVYEEWKRTHSKRFEILVRILLITSMINIFTMTCTYSMISCHQSMVNGGRKQIRSIGTRYEDEDVQLEKCQIGQ